MCSSNHKLFLSNSPNVLILVDLPHLILPLRLKQLFSPQEGCNSAQDKHEILQTVLSEHVCTWQAWDPSDSLVWACLHRTSMRSFRQSCLRPEFFQSARACRSHCYGVLEQDVVGCQAFHSIAISCLHDAWSSCKTYDVFWCLEFTLACRALFAQGS